MANSVDRIEQDIAALNQHVGAIAADLHQGYLEYLNALGEAVRKQLILAGYHVCTQGYPQQFLSLTVGQRQDLQHALRQMAQQLQADLSAVLSEPDVLRQREVDPNDPLNNLSNDPPSDPSAATSALLTPEQLADWQDDLEHAIVKELRTISHQANRLLQQATILPKKLPDFLLQTASQSEIAEMPAQSANLLNVLVESGDRPPDDDADDEPDPRAGIVQVVAIHLRLSEIEFAEPSVMVLRNRLRSLSARLKVLGKQYHKKQREHAIAQAQDAWRASWFED